MHGMFCKMFRRIFHILEKFPTHQRQDSRWSVFTLLTNFRIVFGSGANATKRGLNEEVTRSMNHGFSCLDTGMTLALNTARDVDHAVESVHLEKKKASKENLAVRK